jgi:hypothetical protein
VKRFVRENSLALCFGALFLLAVGFQAIAGWQGFNDDQTWHHSPKISFFRYVTSSSYGAAVMENWQSEYLQFTLYILLTVWLIQRGSPESKEPGKEGGESDSEQKVAEHAEPDSPRWAKVGGVRTWIYSNSLILVMATIWLGTWVAQSITGVSEYNAERLSHQLGTISWAHYIQSADFWERTLQNWQSEFLAVGSFVVLAIYLRQRGSSQSKPVGASHDATGVES